MKKNIVDEILNNDSKSNEIKLKAKNLNHINGISYLTFKNVRKDYHLPINETCFYCKEVLNDDLTSFVIGEEDNGNMVTLHVECVSKVV